MDWSQMQSDLVALKSENQLQAEHIAQYEAIIEATFYDPGSGAIHVKRPTSNQIIGLCHRALERIASKRKLERDLQVKLD